MTDTALDTCHTKSRARYQSYKSVPIDWLCEVPEHWEVKRLKCSIIACQNGIWGDEPGADDDTVGCVRVADFDRQRLVVDDSVELTQRSVPTSKQSGRVLERGDLLLEKSGGGDNQPVGALVLFDSSAKAVCSNFVARVSVAIGYDSSFLRYLHACLYSGRLNTRSMKQSTGIQNLDSGQYFDEPVAFPPLTEQRAIAAFLDRETARIDTLVAKKQRLIDLLEEKRQAVISHVVTKGLDASVEMKQSGAQCLGEVPSHWCVERVKTTSTCVTSGPRGWSERIANDGSVFIQSGDLDHRLNVDFANAKRVQVEIDAESNRAQLREGDVVVCVTGAKTGNVAVCDRVPETAYLNQHLCLIRPNTKVAPMYLGLLLKSSSGQSYFEAAQYGIKQGLSLDDIREAPVLVPPMDEQLAILAFVQRETQRAIQLLEYADDGIRLLIEYRTALISAAVTGRIDIREELTLDK